jgi:hypothetical protein
LFEFLVNLQFHKINLKMKTILKNFKISLKGVKALVILILVLSVSATSLRGQDLKKFAFGPGLSLNIGVFNPEDVNAYIANALSGYTILLGNTDMILYYEVSGFFTFKTRWVDIIPTFNYAISPKIVVGAENFYFSRISPGVLANFCIPVGMSGKNAFFIGGGIQYHKMKFEESEGSTFEANKLGFRAQLGFDLQAGSFNLSPTLAYNIADSQTAGLDMNYSGFQLGLVMSFHKPVSRRRI